MICRLGVILVIISAAIFSLANAAVKKPLYEVFTSSSCPPCALANPVIDSLLLKNPSAFTMIKYQMNFPAPADPYATSEGMARASYYSVTGIPQFEINGHDTDVIGITQAKLDSALQIQTDISITASGSIVGDSALLHVVVHGLTGANHAAGLILHTSLIEKTTYNNTGTNGETEFSNVMMKMMPDANGSTLSAINDGDSAVYNFAVYIPSTHVESKKNLSIVAFVQDNADKSVLQSEIADIPAPVLPPAKVTFVIQTNEGVPLDFAFLTLGSKIPVVTDLTGTAVYDSVEPGTYKLIINKYQVRPRTLSVTIKSDTTINITLPPNNDILYEAFKGGSTIPTGWALNSFDTIGNSIGFGDGVAFYSMQNKPKDTMILVSKELDLSNLDSIIISATVFGDPVTTVPCKFTFEIGTMASQTDFASFKKTFSIDSRPVWDSAHRVGVLVNSCAISDKFVAFRFKALSNDTIPDLFVLDTVILTKHSTSPIRVANGFAGREIKTAIIGRQLLITGNDVSEIGIYDMRGRLVRSSVASSGAARIDISKLARTGYVLVIKAGGQKTSRPLMLVK